jgi:hypothetical protein
MSGKNSIQDGKCIEKLFKIYYLFYVPIFILPISYDNNKIVPAVAN